MLGFSLSRPVRLAVSNGALLAATALLLACSNSAAKPAGQDGKSAMREADGKEIPSCKESDRPESGCCLTQTGLINCSQPMASELPPKSTVSNSDGTVPETAKQARQPN